MDESINEDPVSEQPAPPDAAENFLVVGLGASAGGVQALRRFFSQVPAHTRMAYVVILHLSPDHDSQLAEVLQSASAIPVTKVERRVRVEPDRVYVIPPNKNLEVEDGHIEVTDVTSNDVRRAPVDIFFRTLAQSHGQRAVSVVLSGTGANGSMGMKRVKEMGGLCIVQDPREAEYDDMPRHSLATGLVDHVDEFRQCVTDFTRGAKAADSFDFDCHYEGSDHPVRVLLARICEHVNRNDTKSVLVHIRRAINNSLRPRNTEVNTNERDVDQ